MNYKDAKQKIREILEDTHYASENGEKYHPFDEKSIIQMMSDIRQDQDFEEEHAEEISMLEAEKYFGESIAFS